MVKPSHDVFALRNLGLEEFLHAEVGTEPNGSMLTVLSALARLDRDPWVEAGRWAMLPRASAIDNLAQIMAETPLRAPAPAGCHATAARLVLLLPTGIPALGLPRNGLPRNGLARNRLATNRLAGLPAVPGAMRLIVLLCCFVLGMVLVNLLLVAPPPTISPAGTQGQATHAEP